MNVTRETCGTMRCAVLDDLPTGTEPDLAVILNHGFGAPGDDLVPIGQHLLQLRPDLKSKVRFWFPQAPLSLDDMGLPGGRAWWPIDLEELSAAVQQGRMRDLRESCPPGCSEAREHLESVVETVLQQTGLTPQKLVLGGFSQGAMISTEVALRAAVPPALLAIFSGTLLNESEWTSLAAGQASMQVLQSHGRQDPLLPFQLAEELRDMFTTAGAEVDFVPFNGEHTITLEALDRLAARLTEIADS